MPMPQPALAVPPMGVEHHHPTTGNRHRGSSIADVGQAARPIPRTFRAHAAAKKQGTVPAERGHRDVETLYLGALAVFTHPTRTAPQVQAISRPRYHVYLRAADKTSPIPRSEIDPTRGTRARTCGGVAPVAVVGLYFPVERRRYGAVYRAVRHC